MSSQPSNSPVRTSVLTRLFKTPRAIVSAALVARKTHSLTAARLLWLARWKWAGTPGFFRFPFGRVHYTDVRALQSMYGELFLHHVYEVAQMPESPRVIDCGGNIGMSVIWFKHRYPKARITVFEADPALADILAENIRHLGLPSVEVVKAAVSGVSGPATFARDRAMTGHLSAGGELTIDCVRLSEHLDDTVDLLKIDIEGSEFCLISDLCASSAIKLVRHLICEIHGSTRVQEQIGDLWTSLSNAGFRLTISGASTHPGLPGAPDPTPFAGVGSGKFLLWLYAWQS